MEEIVTLISTLGFPIVCCIWLARTLTTTIKDFSVNITENTRMLDKLCTKLDKDPKD